MTAVEQVMFEPTDEVWAMEQARSLPDVRKLLIAIGKEQRAQERLKDTLAAVTAEYRTRIAFHEGLEGKLRQMVLDFIVNVNDGEGVSFPDVGRAHTRVEKEKVVVTDRSRLDAVAAELGTTKTVADEPATKARLLELLVKDGLVLPDGFELRVEQKGAVVHLG